MRRRWVGVATAAILVGMNYFAAVANGNEADGEPYVVPTASKSKADLETLSESTVFLAHHSVGYTLEDAMPAPCDRSGVTAPAIAESDVAGRHDGKFYYAMDKAYASDPGHLNPDVARVAASAMAAVLVGTVRYR